MEFTSSKFYDDCDWCIYVTGYLCRYFDIIPYAFISFYCLKNCSTNDICHLIYGVGVKIATDILCVNFL